MSVTTTGRGSTGEGRSETSEKKGDSRGLTGLSTLVSTHPMTWSGSASKPDSLLSAAAFVIELNECDIRDIEHALEIFKKLGLNGDDANHQNFEIPATVKAKLESAAANLHEGCGLANLRGLDSSRYSDEDNLTLFLALSDYIGDIRGVQNRQGDMITHITDARQWDVPYSMRHGIHTNKDLPFHNDMGADILALQVRQCAEEGGHTYVASAGTVFCELVARRPDVLEILTRPDWPIQVSGSPHRFALVPLLQWYKEKIMVNLDPGRLGLHPNMTRHFGGESIPALTPTQRDALLVVSSIATEHRLRLDTQPGDIVFINNWAHMHARSSYKDCGLGGGPRRHLVRLWLRNSTLGWEIPPGMRIQWEAAFGPDGMGDKNQENGYRKSQYRGSGIFCRNYPVTPAPEYKVPKYTTASAAFVIEDDSDPDIDG